MPFNNRGGNHGGFANPGVSSPGVTYPLGGTALDLAHPNVHTFGYHSVYLDIYDHRSGGTGFSVVTANLIHYLPFVLPESFIVASVFWENGGVVNGNVDVGVYDGTSLAKLVSSGSTVQAGASTIQVAAAGPVTLAAGTLYYFAHVSNSATGQFRSDNPTAGNVIYPCWAVQQQSATFPLPATATFGAIAANEIPYVGVSRRSVF